MKFTRRKEAIQSTREAAKASALAALKKAAAQGKKEISLEPRSPKR